MIRMRRILGRATNHSSARGRQTDQGLPSARHPSRKRADLAGTAGGLSVRQDRALMVPGRAHSTQGPLPARGHTAQHRAHMVRRAPDLMVLHRARMDLLPVRKARPRGNSVPQDQQRSSVPAPVRGFSGR